MKIYYKNNYFLSSNDNKLRVKSEGKTLLSNEKNPLNLPTSRKWYTHKISYVHSMTHLHLSMLSWYIVNAHLFATKDLQCSRYIISHTIWVSRQAFIIVNKVDKQRSIVNTSLNTLCHHWCCRENCQYYLKMYLHLITWFWNSHKIHS